MSLTGDKKAFLEMALSCVKAMSDPKTREFLIKNRDKLPDRARYFVSLYCEPSFASKILPEEPQ